jgi:hypothetical protein
MIEIEDIFWLEEVTVKYNGINMSNKNYLAYPSATAWTIR